MFQGSDGCSGQPAQLARYVATAPDEILGGAIFSGSNVDVSKRFENRGGYKRYKIAASKTLTIRPPRLTAFLWIRFSGTITLICFKT